MQRLHPEDFTASVQEEEHWDVVALPALAESAEIYSIRTPCGLRRISREAGEALHPARESADRLNAIREKDTYVFSAQYQQNPMPREGSIIKPEWLSYYDEGELPREFDRKIQSWDTANKAGQDSSFNVCTTWQVTDGHYYLLDVFREQMLFDKLKPAAIDLAERYRPTKIIIEAQATGAALLAELMQAGYPAEAAPPSSESKEERLLARIDRFVGGYVHIPRTAHGIDAYVDELTRFPYSKFSDQVDSTVQALGPFALGEGGSFGNAIKAMELLGAEPETRRVKIYVPPGARTLIGRDGHNIPVSSEGIAELDERDANGFMLTNPGIRKI